MAPIGQYNSEEATSIRSSLIIVLLHLLHSPKVKTQDAHKITFTPDSKLRNLHDYDLLQLYVARYLYRPSQFLH